MPKQLKHFVQFYCTMAKIPGTALVQEVKSRNISGLCFPENTYAFRFFDAYLSENERVTGSTPVLNDSPMIYRGREILKIDEVLKRFTLRLVFVERMTHEGWQEVVLCEDGSLRRFGDNDLYMQI